MRKAFNFYRSYFDVINELNDKDKLQFLMALLNRQFNGIEPTLSGQANFAYISQKHSIDSQVTGYEYKTKQKLEPTIPPLVGGAIPPTVQEKGEEKEEYTIPTILEFLDYCKNIKEFDFSEYKFSLESKYQSWVDNNWKDGNNSKIKNWKSKIRNTYPHLKPIKPKSSINISNWGLGQ